MIERFNNLLASWYKKDGRRLVNAPIENDIERKFNEINHVTDIMASEKKIIEEVYVLLERGKKVISLNNSSYDYLLQEFIDKIKELDKQLYAIYRVYDNIVTAKYKLQTNRSDLIRVSNAIYELFQNPDGSYCWTNYIDPSTINNICNIKQSDKDHSLFSKTGDIRKLDKVFRDREYKIDTLVQEFYSGYNKLLIQGENVENLKKEYIFKLDELNIKEVKNLTGEERINLMIEKCLKGEKLLEERKKYKEKIKQEGQIIKDDRGEYYYYDDEQKKGFINERHERLIFCLCDIKEANKYNQSRLIYPIKLDDICNKRSDGYYKPIASDYDKNKVRIEDELHKIICEINEIEEEAGRKIKYTKHEDEEKRGNCPNHQDEIANTAYQDNNGQIIRCCEECSKEETSKRKYYFEFMCIACRQYAKKHKYAYVNKQNELVCKECK